MKEYIMVLDQGTTSCRCILFDRYGTVVSKAQKEFRQIYPKASFVEHDPVEIWSTQIGAAHEAMLLINTSFENIAAIGITNQRETTIVWDKYTGEPIYNAIVWQCRRTAPLCDKLKEQGYTDFFKEKTGLLIDAYFSATKLKWILDNVDGAREKAEQGDLLFGTIDSWLVWKLTGGKSHVTDYSNASRTMLFNIHALDWDNEILSLLNIPRCMLPKAAPSSSTFGETSPLIFGAPIPITGIAGDQQAALFGQTCFEKGNVKNTYGTGGFLLMNTGDKPVSSKNGLLTTIAWGLNGKVTYALEGSIFICGAAVQWLRDEIGLIDYASQTKELAINVKSSNGVYVVPAFVGLGAPYWNSYARGTILGITRGTNRNHIVRATLESLAFQTYDVLKAMEEDSDLSLNVLNVDGGASENDFLMQFQSNILGIDVIRPTCFETTALGASYLAGLGIGFYKSLDDIKENARPFSTFHSAMLSSERDEFLKNWKRAIRCALLWGESE